MKRISLAVFALALAASYLIVFLPMPVAGGMLREDGPIEQATMIFFLIAAVSLVAAWKLRGAEGAARETGDGHRIFLLGLAVLMFICAGEEISWGQRIFGWRTPEGWSAQNAQSETNLHNLAIIEGGVRDHTTQTFLRSLTNANRLFAIFWLTFFVLVPVLDRVSAAARGFFRVIGLPIPPLWVGVLFILNHAVFYLAGRYVVAAGLDATDGYPLDELKEHHGALVYAVTGVAAWLRARPLAPSGALLPHRA